MAPKSSRLQRRMPRSRDCVKSSELHMERLPPEVILKILSYLDAGSLFCLGFVNKHFYELADDNAMWYRFYARQRAAKKRPRRIAEVTDGMGVAGVQEKPKGFWRRLFFKELAGLDENWRKKLKGLHYHGLPSQTQRLLRRLRVTWQIVVTDERGQESTFQQTHVHFGDTVVSVSWSVSEWPVGGQSVTLRLYGVVQVPLNCPHTYRPGWRSLMTRLNLNTNEWSVCAADQFIKLQHTKHGVIRGVWQKQEDVAFVIMNLYYDRLVERSLLGSSTTPYQPTEVRPPFDDVDPEYGLHGYTAHLELHNTEQSLTYHCFPKLFCRKDQMVDGFIPLRAISKSNTSQHSPVSGDFRLPWRTEALQGLIKGCCMLSLTVFDEFNSVFWYVSAPVSLTRTSPAGVSYDWKENSFSLMCEDSDGKVEAELEWREDERQYFLVGLVIFLSVSKVNRLFGRNY